MSNDRLNDYRRYSLEAEEQAKMALRDEDRASWLRIAQAWLSLIPARRMTSAEALDDIEDKSSR